MKMNSKYTTLAIEMENLQRKENEMYNYYSELVKVLKNKEVKEKIKHIRDQELGHIKMVTQIISILWEDIRKG